jgi:hypothetical protein
VKGIPHSENAIPFGWIDRPYHGCRSAAKDSRLRLNIAHWKIKAMNYF